MARCFPIAQLLNTFDVDEGLCYSAHRKINNGDRVKRAQARACEKLPPGKLLNSWMELPLRAGEQVQEALADHGLLIARVFGDKHVLQESNFKAAMLRRLSVDPVSEDQFLDLRRSVASWVSQIRRVTCPEVANVTIKTIEAEFCDHGAQARSTRKVGLYTTRPVPAHGELLLHESSTISYLQYEALKRADLYCASAPVPVHLPQVHVPPGVRARLLTKPLSFVITGILPSLDRYELFLLIRERGGRISTTVERSTDYVVAGHHASEGKILRARQLGKPILEEADFLSLLSFRAKDAIAVGGCGGFGMEPVLPYSPAPAPPQLSNSAGPTREPCAKLVLVRKQDLRPAVGEDGTLQQKKQKVQQTLKVVSSGQQKTEGKRE